MMSYLACKANRMPRPVDREDLPEHYASHKEHQVKTSKEGKAKWRAELASNSEADV